MNKKDISALSQYLDTDVLFLGPMAEIKGKDAVVKAAQGSMSFFNHLVIRTKCSNQNEVMLAYDLHCPAPIGLFRVAALMTFQNDLIIRIELFYDARPFEKGKE